MSFFGGNRAVLNEIPKSLEAARTIKGIGERRAQLYLLDGGILKGQYADQAPFTIANLANPVLAEPIVPTGAVFQWVLPLAPTGYALCNGQSVSGTEYDALYQVIGTTFGGPGGGIFNLPNMGGRVPIGAGSLNTEERFEGSLAVGARGGNLATEIDSENLPEHSHGLDVALTEHTHLVDIPGHAHNFDTTAGSVVAHAHTLDFETSSAYDEVGLEQTTLAHDHGFTDGARSWSDADEDAASGGDSVSTPTDLEHTHVPTVDSDSSDSVTFTVGGSTGVPVDSDLNTSETSEDGAHQHRWDIDGLDLDFVHPVDGSNTDTLAIVTDAAAPNGVHTHTIETGGGHSHSIDGGAADAGVGGEADSGDPLIVVGAADTDHTHDILDDAAAPRITGGGSAHTHGAGLTGSAGAHQHRWDIDQLEVTFDAESATEVDGTHTHGVSVADAGAHQHRWDIDQLEVNFDADSATEVDGAHTHGVSVADAGAHQHRWDIDELVVSFDADSTTTSDGAHWHHVDVAEESEHTHPVGDDITPITVNNGQHNHSIEFDGSSVTEVDGQHTHLVSVDTEPAHTHPIVGGAADSDASGSNADGDADPYVNVDEADADHTHSIDHDGAEPRETGSEAAHTHTFVGTTNQQTSDDGSHQHAWDTDELVIDGGIDNVSDGMHTHGGATDQLGDHGHTPQLTSGTLNAGTLSNGLLTDGAGTLTGADVAGGDTSEDEADVNDTYELHNGFGTYQGNNDSYSDYAALETYDWFVTLTTDDTSSDAGDIGSLGYDNFTDTSHQHSVDGGAVENTATNLNNTAVTGSVTGTVGVGITEGNAGRHQHTLVTFPTTNQAVDEVQRGAHTHAFTGTIDVDEDADAGPGTGADDGHLDEAGLDGQLTRKPHDPTDGSPVDAAHTHTVTATGDVTADASGTAHVHTIDVVTGNEDASHSHTLTGDTAASGAHDHAAVALGEWVTGGDSTVDANSKHSHTITAGNIGASIPAEDGDHDHDFSTDTAAGTAHVHTATAVSTWATDGVGDAGHDATSAHAHAFDALAMDVSIELDSDAATDVTVDGQLTKNPDADTGFEDAAHTHAATALATWDTGGNADLDASSAHSHTITAGNIGATIDLTAGATVDTADGQLTKKPDDADGDGADAAHTHAATALATWDTGGNADLDASSAHSHTITAGNIGATIDLTEGATVDYAPDGQLTKKPTDADGDGADAAHTHSIGSENAHTHDIDVTTSSESAAHSHTIDGDTGSHIGHSHNIQAGGGAHAHTISGSVAGSLSVDASAGQHGAADAQSTQNLPTDADYINTYGNQDATHSHDLGAHTHSFSGTGTFDLSDEFELTIANNTEALDHHHETAETALNHYHVLHDNGSGDAITGSSAAALTGGTAEDGGDTVTSQQANVTSGLSTERAGLPQPDKLKVIQPYMVLAFIIKL